MIDHLMNFATEAAAQADPIVGAYWTPADNEGDPGAWRGDCTIPGVSVYSITGSQTITITNPDGSTSQETVPTTQPFPGWFIIISLTAVDPNLQAETGCILIADRDMANAGNPNFLLYTQPGLTSAELAAAKVSPTFAGSNYPFGAP